MNATSRLTAAERATVIGQTIARDIWSAHKKLRSGRLLAAITDVFVRGMTQSMSVDIRDAALLALVELDERQEGEAQTRIHH